MRRFATLFALLASASLAPIVPACSSAGETTPNDAGGDAAPIPPNQLVGMPCDPNLSDPCLPVPCSTVECDPAQLICLSTPIVGPCKVGSEEDASGFSFEASTEDVPVVVVPTCSSNAQCPTIPPAIDGGTPTVLLCGFSAFDGCSATGTCVYPEAPPLTKDGAVETACGCNGQPVPYITSTDTSAPVKSLVPCSALTGEDAGPDAADAGADASIDAAADAPPE